MPLDLPWLDTADAHQARLRSSALAFTAISALAVWGFASGWSAVRGGSVFPAVTAPPATPIAAHGEQVVFNGLAWFAPAPARAAARAARSQRTEVVVVDQHVELVEGPAPDAVSAGQDAAAREEAPPSDTPLMIEAPPSVQPPPPAEPASPSAP
ncbi:MAG: hypothetical protein U1E50_11560 [Caulobacteraceae bacterium]